MAKFIAIIKQKSEGCDYSIGCGTCIDSLEAGSLEEAFQKLIRTSPHFCDYFDGCVDPSFLQDGEHAIDSVELIEVAASDTGMYPKWLKSMISEAGRIQKEKEEAAELAEFERLKKKLNK